MDRLWIRVRDIRALLGWWMRFAVGSRRTDRGDGRFSSAGRGGSTINATLEALGYTSSAEV
jgi:hypothetical protein